MELCETVESANELAVMDIPPARVADPRPLEMCHLPLTYLYGYE